MSALRLCRCSACTGTEVVDGGIVLCTSCGERVADPLLLLIARQQHEILRRLDRLEHGGEEADNGSGRLLSPRELADRLGMSAQWIREHAEDLGGIRLGAGPKPRYHFDPELARERLAARSNRSEPTKPKQRRRRKRRVAGTELLPVKDRA